jgi:hypothetical protein
MIDDMPSTSSHHYQPAARVGSRLAKVEQKKLWRQTLLFSGGAVGLLIIFLLVILPTIIKFMAGSDLGVVDSDDTIPPQTPMLSAPVPATNSATLALSGFTEAKATVYLINGGQRTDEKTTDDQGSFVFDISLNQGENHLSVVAADEAGNESAASREFVVIYDNESPMLELKDLTNGQEIVGKDKQSLTIAGKTEPKARVTVNDRLTTATSEGDFSLIYRLNEGENELKFKVMDQAGNQYEMSIKVLFKQ